MSTKTISKRVALATVVALGAGVLSLVSVSSASALGSNAALGSNPALAVASTLYIAGSNSTTGTAVATATSTTAPASVPDVTAAKSFGLLAVGDIAGNSTPVAGTTQTATLTSAGGLSVYESAASGNIDAISVTGGTISSFSGSSNVQLNSSLTVAANGGTVGTPATGAINNWGVVVKPNSGVSTMTVQLWTGAGTVVATNLAGYASLTLSGQITVSVAATNLSGTLSLTNSKIVYNSTTTGSDKDANSVGIGTSDYATVQYAEVVLKDAYNVAVPTGGYLTASATNGAYVALATSGAVNSNVSAGTASTSFVGNNGTNVGMTVGAGALTATGGSTVVTVSYNGTVLGTKAFTFTGKIAKVVLTNQSNGVVGGTGVPNQVGLKLYDASGNAITFASATAGTTAYPLAITKDANGGFKALGAGIGTIYLPTSTTAGFITYTCTQTVTDAAQVDYSNADGTVIVSNQAPMSCSGNAYTYTAALDKASYTPGEIATLKVTFKDSTGALANDLATGISGGTTATTPSISGGNLTAVTAPTSADATTNGVATYKFIVGVSTGSYQLIASFPTVNANAVASAQTVSYKVADGSTSLNDVLKGIVSLIASINKQIAALAKLVTKK
jgi:hypothetical protein